MQTNDSTVNQQLTISSVDQLGTDGDWTIYGQRLTSRMLLGTALYPSPVVMQTAILESGCEVVTVGLRRLAGGFTDQETQQHSQQFFQLLKQLNKHLLPNTAGCRTVHEAVTFAHMAQELFGTNWIKLEVIGDEYNLQPDPMATIEAAKHLIKDGFRVFPYCTDDLVVCQRLVDAGCEVVMPWASPIGTGQGLLNPYALETIRTRLPHTCLIVDAGLGKPSDACRALELGADAVLLNTAVAKATDPVKMAKAFAQAVMAGRMGYVGGMMPKRQTAMPSTPVLDQPIWHQLPRSVENNTPATSAKALAQDSLSQGESRE